MSPSGIVVQLLVPDGRRSRILAGHRHGRPVLPSIAPDLRQGERVATALQRELRAGWHLDPIVLELHLPASEPGASGTVGLAVLDAPPPEWPPPSGLAWASKPVAIRDAIASADAVVSLRARRWLDEWTTGAPPAALRPPWARSGWAARVEAWIDEALRRSGRTRTGPLEIRRTWALSTLLRVPTTAGAAWFKASFPHFGHEPSVTALLAASVPMLTPPVIAADASEGWLLLEDGGRPLRDDPARDAAVIAAVDQLADAQERTRPNLDEFAAIGCPRRPLSGLAGALSDALADAPALGGFEIERRRADRVVEWIAERTARIDALGMGEVLVHGDFHPGNLLANPFGTRIIDWSDAAVSHPIVEIGAWFGEVEPPLRPAGWAAWLAALSRFGPVEELRDEHEETFAVAAAYQVVSYAGILRAMEPESRHQVQDGFGGYWKSIDRVVPRSRAAGPWHRSCPS